MKTKKKLIISVIALCLMLCTTVGVVTAVLAAQNATATSTFTVNYTATPQVNASVGASYGVATYGTNASSAGFTDMTISGVSSISSPYRFYPTTSTTQASFDSVATTIQAYNFLVVKYVFTNYSTTKALNVSATINQVQSVSGHDAFAVKYIQPNSTNDVTFVSLESGEVTAPTLTDYSSGTMLTISAASSSSTPTISHIYLVFLLTNPDSYGGSLGSIVWSLSPAI